MQLTKAITTDKTTILIVDDRQENILTLENIIESDHRIIRTALSGNEALKIVMKQPVDLMLMDVQMPEMDGYEVADLMRLNPRTSHIPIVFVSAASRSDKNSLHKYKYGTVDFLFKPLDLEETRRKVIWIENQIRLSKEMEKLKDINAFLKKDFNQFVYLVTHDIKAPIRAIDNLINWITEDMGNSMPASVAENFSLLQNRVNRTQRLLNALTDYSRISRKSESPQPVELNKLIHATIETLEIPPAFRVIVTGCDFVFTVEKEMLIRVFIELIKNAFQHNEKKEGEINISCEEMPDEYVFTIQDDGPGIPKRLEEKAFEIFQTLKSKDDFENTGIGLPLVSRLLTNLGQRIWIDRSRSDGTTIKFSWHK